MTGASSGRKWGRNCAQTEQRNGYGVRAGASIVSACKRLLARFSTEYADAPALLMGRISNKDNTSPAQVRSHTARVARQYFAVLFQRLDIGPAQAQENPLDQRFCVARPVKGRDSGSGRRCSRALNSQAHGETVYYPAPH